MYKVYINDDPVFCGKVKFGQNCLLCLYQAQISGDHLQDHWSSGLHVQKAGFLMMWLILYFEWPRSPDMILQD